MGLLDGTIQPTLIEGITVSQVFFKLQFGALNAIKARTSLLPNIYRVRSAFSTSVLPLMARTVRRWSLVPCD
jgi:hypothetical protein